MGPKIDEFDRFDRTMDELLKVKPKQIKANLEAEKETRAERSSVKRTRRKSEKSKAS